MMRDRGHTVIIYGGEGADVECYKETEPLPFDPPLWADANYRAAVEINKRREDGDFLLLVAGFCQEEIARAVPLMTVEAFVGYGGCFADFRVFESYAWLHCVMGAQSDGNAHGIDGRFYDAVIPNYFEVEDFPMGSGGDYLLYMGRLINRKGVEIAVEVARHTGRTLYLAGEGDFRPGEGEENIHYVGSVNPEERAELMGGARALLAPTVYVEPFGGCVVEAQLCGTPCITTDWGAFPETNIQGVTGYRCHRLGEFIWAVERAHELDRQEIRDRAIANYSTEAVAPLYEHYFEHLETLDGAGWYDATPSRPAVS